jgi:hypothetical protein
VGKTYEDRKLREEKLEKQMFIPSGDRFMCTVSADFDF